MHNDEFSWYIAKLGYQIVNQGDSGFKVICKEKKPIGFLSDTGSISCVQGEESEVETLRKASDFVSEYHDCTPVGGHEFLLGKFDTGTLTTYFDISQKETKYVVYGLTGEGTTFSRQDYSKAVQAFLAASGLQKYMIQKSRKKNRFRFWLARKLMGAEAAKEVQKNVSE